MNDGKGMSIAALVLGILSAIFAWWGLYIGIVSLVCGIVGIVLAVKGKKAAAAAGAPTGRWSCTCNYRYQPFGNRCYRLRNLRRLLCERNKGN